MAKQSNPLENDPKDKLSPPAEEPGLLESYGSFPVWMLKIIQSVTPDFLVEKKPKDKKPPQN